MRSHKNISMTVPTLLGDLGGQELKELLSVVVIGIDVLSRVASGGDMVEGSFVFDP